MLRLGTYIKFIPYPVTVGFTAGIAVIIFASQLRDLLGITLARQGAGRIDPEAGSAGARAAHRQCRRPSRSPSLSIAIIVGSEAGGRHWPGILIAVAVAALAACGAVAAGGNHRHPLRRHSRATALAGMAGVLAGEGLAVLPDAIAFALLGAIESLLSAVVADGMTGRRHRSNCELVAQGFANIGSALFGGICVTGTIARTATNVRAGARGPVPACCIRCSCCCSC